MSRVFPRSSILPKIHPLFPYPPFLPKPLTVSKPPPFHRLPKIHPRPQSNLDAQLAAVDRKGREVWDTQRRLDIVVEQYGKLVERVEGLRGEIAREWEREGMG